MAVVSELEKKQYLQGFKWAISYSDGHVTTHKMLEFINKRTDRDVIYKPPLTTMLATFFGFISVAAVGVLIYVKLKFIWTNWIVWLVGSLLIYVTCVSGVVYDIIHDVPFVGRDKTTGEALIFADGNR
jgi:oligosaccharyltransferase complex subunit gamma